MRRLALLHLSANAVLLWLGYYWLGVGESRAATLVWSALLALVVMCLACMAYAAPFAHFQGESRPWRTTLRHLLPLVLGSIAVAIVYVLLARWAEYSSTPASQIASYLTLKFRKPVRPSSVLALFNGALWLVRWVLLPVLLLPMMSAIASRGWQGFRSVGGLARKWLYWIEAPVLLVLAFWVPLKLLGWVPGMSGFGMEAVSFALRAIAAYLLFGAAWLVLAFVTSAGIPRLTQSNTAPSP